MTVSTDENFNFLLQVVSAPAALVGTKIRVLAHTQAAIYVGALEDCPGVIGFVRWSRAAADLRTGLLC